MPISDKIRDSIKVELLKARPLMDVDRVREEIFEWLAEIKGPVFRDVTTWEKNIKVLPLDDEDKSEVAGRRIRFALHFYTKENQYLITIIENLALSSRDVYIISVIVNWSNKERQNQQMIDQAYTGNFEDTLRARHTLWAQTFQIEELHDALSNCAVAILGNELVEKCESKNNGVPLTDIYPQNVSFPKPSEDEK